MRLYTLALVTVKPRLVWWTTSRECPCLGRLGVFMFVFLFLSLDFLVFFLHTGKVVGKCFHGSSGVALSLIPCSESPHHPEYLMAGSMADLRQIVTPPMVVIRLSMFAFHPSYLHLLIISPSAFLELTPWTWFLTYLYPLQVSLKTPATLIAMLHAARLASLGACLLFHQTIHNSHLKNLK